MTSFFQLRLFICVYITIPLIRCMYILSSDKSVFVLEGGCLCVLGYFFFWPVYKNRCCKYSDCEQLPLMLWKTLGKSVQSDHLQKPFYFWRECKLFNYYTCNESPLVARSFAWRCFRANVSFTQSWPEGSRTARCLRKLLLLCTQGLGFREEKTHLVSWLCVSHSCTSHRKEQAVLWGEDEL